MIQWWSAKGKYIYVSRFVWKSLVLECLLYYLSILIFWESREYTKNILELYDEFWDNFSNTVTSLATLVVPKSFFQDILVNLAPLDPISWILKAVKTTAPWRSCEFDTYKHNIISYLLNNKRFKHVLNSGFLKPGC